MDREAEKKEEGAGSDEEDTLNSIENIRQEDSEEVLRRLERENLDIRQENLLLRRKHGKYRAVKAELQLERVERARLLGEQQRLQEELQAARRQHQLPIHEAPVQSADIESRLFAWLFVLQERDVVTRECGVQADLAGSREEGGEDYFTAVIIDQLKQVSEPAGAGDLFTDLLQEIFELKQEKKKAEKEGSSRVPAGQSLAFRQREEDMAAQVARERKELRELRQDQQQEEEEEGGEVERLKQEVARLQQANGTLESYVTLLKQSYTSVFGPINK